MIVAGQVVRWLDENGCWCEAEVLHVEDEQAVSLDLNRNDDDSKQAFFTTTSAS